MAYREMESQIYRDSLDAWLIDHHGEWVAISGDIVVGFYPTYETAYLEAATALLSRDFFLKQIAQKYKENRKPTLRRSLA